MRLSNLVDASIFFLKLRAVLSLFARTWNMPQGLVVLTEWPHPKLYIMLQLLRSSALSLSHERSAK